MPAGVSSLKKIVITTRFALCRTTLRTMSPSALVGWTVWPVWAYLTTSWVASAMTFRSACAAVGASATRATVDSTTAEWTSFMGGPSRESGSCGRRPEV
jgi:hypothetical protein